MLDVAGEENPMPIDRPDPSDFLALAQRMLRELFGDARDGEEPWADATRSARESRGPSAEQQRENLTFALATRAVEALEDLALNVAAIRQRLERMSPRPEEPRADGDDATGQ
jgi:uncharacterized membrane protein YccC